jgi:hypothetical protein
MAGRVGLLGQWGRVRAFLAANVIAIAAIGCACASKADACEGGSKAGERANPAGVAAQDGQARQGTLKCPPQMKRAWQDYADELADDNDLSLIVSTTLISAGVSVLGIASAPFWVGPALIGAGVGAFIAYKEGKTALRSAKRVIADPPDPDFMEIASVDQPAVAQVPKIRRAPEQLRKAQNAFVTDLATTSAVTQAMVTSYERYQGAVAAGNQEWIDRQACATGSYASQVASGLTELPADERQISKAVEDDALKGDRRFTLPLDEFKEAQERVKKRGLPKKFRLIIEESGLDEDILQRLASWIIDLPPREAAPVQVHRDLRKVVPDLSESANEAAAATQQFAQDALDLCPRRLLGGTITIASDELESSSAFMFERHLTVTVNAQFMTSPDGSWTDNGSTATATGTSTQTYDAGGCSYRTTGSYSGVRLPQPGSDRRCRRLRHRVPRQREHHHRATRRPRVVRGRRQRHLSTSVRWVVRRGRREPRRAGQASTDVR